MKLPCEGLWDPGTDFTQGRRYLHPQLILRSRFGAAGTDSLSQDLLGALRPARGSRSGTGSLQEALVDSEHLSRP